MPTCIKCEKVMKSGYKKITVLKPEQLVCEYECKGGCVVEPKEPDYKDSEEYKKYEWVNRQNEVVEEEKISLFGITMINMFRREMGKMREENERLNEEFRPEVSVGWGVCWENIPLNQGWCISKN